MKRKSIIIFSAVTLMVLAYCVMAFNALSQEPNRYNKTAKEAGIKADSIFATEIENLSNPVILPHFTFNEPSTGIAIKARYQDFEDDFIVEPFDYENTETVFILEGKEVLRFFEDSIIIYFKGKEIVIKEDSLCNLLNEITKETFNY